MIKKDHKFFEVIMKNYLVELNSFLIQKQDDMLAGLIPGIPSEEISKYDKLTGVTTQLGNYYNIFDKENFGHDALRDLQKFAMNQEQHWIPLV